MIQTTRPPMWRRYLQFWGPDIEADVKDELDFHIDMRAQELIESGWPRNEARQEALRLFGDMQDVRSECRNIDKRREKTLRRAFVALINEAFAREASGDANPLGRQIHIREKQQGPKVEIIGVYRDSRDLGLREGTYPAVFLPYQQHLEHLSGMTFSVRSHHDPEPLLGLVRDRVKEVDPNLPLFETKTLTQKIESMVAQEKRFVHLSTLSGGLALLLACIGIYGTLSASVSRRTQEIGIRMALGAQRGDILSSVMRAMFMVALGVGIGLSGAWALTRWLSSLLFQLTATDPMTLLVAVLVLVGVAGIAVYIPARRASLVEPMVALRFE